MTRKPIPSQALLQQLLRYEPETGRLFWLERPAEMFRCAGQAKRWNTRHAGKEALTADSGTGYRCGYILGRKHKAHRVIWCMQTGEWPSELTDHRDGIRSNNRWLNLRAATPSENCRNTSRRPGSSSQYIGVSIIKRKRQWVAKIKDGGRIRHLGTFTEEIEAALAYDAAARKTFGHFARPNFPEIVDA